MSASTAVLKAEAKLFAREPVSVFWVVAFPALLLVILGLIPAFRAADPAIGGRRVVDLYVPVSVLLALIMAGIQAMPPVLTGYRDRGVLRRMSTTPVKPVSLLAAQIVLHGGAALTSAALVIAVGRVGFGVRLPEHLVGYAVALVLATLCALAMGGAISAVAANTKIATVLGSAVFFPMMFVAGVYVPVQSMPETLRNIVEIFPFGAASQALDQAGQGAWPDAAFLGPTALWATVFVGIAVSWFRWA